MYLNPNIAEITGALLGDGCLSQYYSKSQKRNRYEIAFTGNIDEFDYYRDFIQPSLDRNFGVKGRLFSRNNNSTRFHIQSKRIFDYFIKLGIPSGKKSYKIFMPEPFFSDKKLILACLRGIWDTDGSIYKRYSKQYKNHARYYSDLWVLQLKLKSERLVREVKESLSLFSIHSNKVTHFDDAFILRITDQNEINKFLDLIGFRNPHHHKRLHPALSKAI